VSSLKGARSAEWKEGLPGRLPWWKHEPDRPLEENAPAAWVDELGVSTGRPRTRLEAEDYVRAAGRVLGTNIEELTGRGYARSDSKRRILMATVGVERWGQSSRELGTVVGRRGDVVSRWVRWGAARRDDDPDFAEAYDELDRKLSESVGE